MSSSTFSGPVRVGTVREGASANVGIMPAVQTAAWVQSTTAADTGIIIPAGSQVLEIAVYVTVAPETGNITGGTSATATELFSGLAAGTSADVVLFASGATITDMDTWADVGTSDVSLWLDASAGSTGRGFVSVTYVPGINLA